MSVKTTLNIHRDILEKILEASEMHQKSETELIIILLMKVLRHDTEKIAAPGRLRYQKSDKKDMWHKEHIRYSNREYELFLDLRRLMKMSLSKVLAYAVQKYLNRIGNETNSDNTSIQNYFLYKDIKNRYVYWELWWGIPAKTAQLSSDP